MRGRALFLCLLAFFLAVVPLPAQVTADKPPTGGKGQGKLERQEEWDEVVARFIRFEIGQLKSDEAKLSAKDFHDSLARLDARAIPALVRGLNRAALENYSCPFMMFSMKLRALLSLTDDRKLIGYAVEHLGEGGTQRPPRVVQGRVVQTHRDYSHQLEQLRGEAQRRLVAIVEGKLTARDLAVRQLYSQRAPVVRIAFKAENADVRWAAVRVAAARNRNLHLEEELIERLTDADDDVQQAARLALVNLSHGLDLGPELDAAEKDRTESVQQWRLWWEAKRLGNDLVRTTGKKREELLSQLRDNKGVYYTFALAEAIPDMTGDERKEAQDALAERLTRMTAKTLADKLADENREIRRAAVRAVLSKGGTDNVANLIPLLRDRDREVASIAHNALREMCREDFGPNVWAGDAERVEAVKKWRAWWKSRAAALAK